MTDEWPAPAMYALSAVVYAERGDEILLLKRAEGSALAGQFFLPGGLVEPKELPEDGARRVVRGGGHRDRRRARAGRLLPDVRLRLRHAADLLPRSRRRRGRRRDQPRARRPPVGEGIRHARPDERRGDRPDRGWRRAR